MLFYRVKSEYDNKKRKDGGILIGNELYTAKEKERYEILDGAVFPVEVKKNKTYWVFGARFAMEG